MYTYNHVHVHVLNDPVSTIKRHGMGLLQSIHREGVLVDLQSAECTTCQPSVCYITNPENPLENLWDDCS